MNSDIELFFKTQLSVIAQTQSSCDFTQGWLTCLIIDILYQKAAIFFIYASTVVNVIVCIPNKQLE